MGGAVRRGRRGREGEDGERQAAGLKGPGQASVIPLQGVLCPQGEPVNTHVPMLTPTGPAYATPDRWPLSVPPAPPYL